MNPLLTSEYMPSMGELGTEDVAKVRKILQALWEVHAPGVDARPNSVVGDSFMAGAAPILKAFETAAERLRSDLDPQQVANGVIYSCEVVEKFLANFGVYDLGGYATSGYALLTFSAMPESRIIELPRHLRFTTTEGGPELEIECPFLGNPAIVKPGEAVQEGANEFPASRVGVAAFVVLLPLRSVALMTIPDGTSLLLSEEIPNLTGAAGFSFTTLPTTAGLPGLARKSQIAAHAATPSTMGGLRRYADIYFPGVQAVSAANPGDPEQVRASISPLGFPRPAVDVFVAGKRSFRLITQSVRLFYDAGGQRFTGAFLPLSTPQLLEGIAWASDASVTLTPEVWMGCPNRDLPGALAAGSGDEKYWITLPMPMSGDEELLTIEPDAGDGPYAWFNITYRADDEVARFRAALRGPDWKMYGTDLAVFPFRVSRISSLRLTYQKRAGARMTLEQAKQEILADIASAVFPSRLSPAAWTESLNFAGARIVTGIDVDAQIQWGIATHIIPGDADPVADFDAADGAKMELTPVSLTSSYTLADGFIDTDIGESSSLYRVAGPRNTVWFALPSVITFVEAS